MEGVRRGYDMWAARYDDRDPSTLLDEPLLVLLARPRGRTLSGRRVVCAEVPFTLTDVPLP